MQRKGSPSSKRRPTAGQSLPIRFWYAASTDAKRGSEAGCVDAKARSRTYRSTALSSTRVEVYARPKSMRT